MWGLNNPSISFDTFQCSRFHFFGFVMARLKKIPVFGLYYVGCLPPSSTSLQPALFNSLSSSLYFTLASFLL